MPTVWKTPAIVSRGSLARALAPLALSGLVAAAPVSPPAPLAPAALQREIDAIRAIDDHAHVVRPVPGDRDYDALPLDGLEATDNPARLRPDHPIFLRAWKALYGYPFADAGRLRDEVALKATALARRGADYPAWVLDQAHVGTVLANRIAMGPELTPPRFRWVAYADALLFPLDNAGAKAANADYAVLYPLEEALLTRYLADVHLAAIPPTLDEYCRAVITATLERQKAGGALAEKLEAAYLRWLDFGPASQPDAAATYARYARGGTPSAGEYKNLQDYLFGYLVREAGRLGLAVHIHVANLAGAHYDPRAANPLLLTWAFNEPAFSKTRFVIIHGGFPYIAETAGLIAKPNVYADTSIWAFVSDARQQSGFLRTLLQAYPEKVLFGSDASPSGDGMGWEETEWVASRTFRDALGEALTGMLRDGELTPARARQLAHMVLHDNAAQLYGLP